MEEEKNRIKKDFSLVFADLRFCGRQRHPVSLELYSANKELEYGIESYYHVEWKIVDIDESHIYVTNLTTGSKYHISVIEPAALYVDVYRILENGEEISPWNDTDLDIVAYYTPADRPDRLVTRDKRFLYVPERDEFRIFPPLEEWTFRPNPSRHVAECWTYQPLGMGHGLFIHDSILEAFKEAAEEELAKRRAKGEYVLLVGIWNEVVFKVLENGKEII